MIIEKLLDVAKCDVAQILDFCYAAMAAKSGSNERNEILAARAREIRAQAGEGSFLKVVIEVLRGFVASGGSFSFANLHHKADTEAKKRGNPNTVLQTK